MRPVTFGIAALGLAGSLTGDVAAQPPLNNPWVEFEKDNSHLAVDPNQISSGSTETDMAWADLDKNGYVDVVVVRKQPYTTPGKRRNLLLMNYDGVLENKTIQYASASDVPGDLGFNTLTNDRDVVIVDVDNDGWLDVVTATTLSDGDPKHIGHPRVYMNLGGSPWQGLRHEDARAPQMFSFSNGQPQNPRFCSVDAGDVTGDGFADLYFGDYDSSGVGGGSPQGPNEDMNDRLWVNDGSGHFIDESQTRMTGQMLQSAFGMAVEIEDWNGDGVLDVMKDTALNAPQYVAISYNDPNNVGFFNLFDDVHKFAPYHIAAGDLNNDGRLDFISSDDGVDRYRYNLGNDSFGRVDFSGALTYGGAGECVSGGCTDDGFGSNALIVDLDGDGWNEAIHCDVDVDIPSTQRRMHIFHNPGGAPGEQIILHEEQELVNNSAGWKGVKGMNVLDQQGTHDVAVFDVENDGDLDMLVSRFNGTDLWENKTIDVPNVCATDLGFQGPGAVDLSLCGTGLDTGGANTLSLSGAPGNANVFLLASLTGGVDATFAGGTLVSLSNLIPGFPVALPTDASGELTFPVPGGGGPNSVVIQAVVVDAAQPLGYAISNAIQADFLP